jgi:hypothetical protein
MCIRDLTPCSIRHTLRHMTKPVTKYPKKRALKCGLCGSKIVHQGPGRPRRYCSDSHRQRAYEQRKLKLVRASLSPLESLKSDLSHAALRDLVAKMVNEALGSHGAPPHDFRPKKPDLRVVTKESRD